MAGIVKTNQLPVINDLTGATIIGLDKNGVDAQFQLDRIVRSERNVAFPNTNPSVDGQGNPVARFAGETWPVDTASYGSAFPGFGNITVPVKEGELYVANARFVWNAGAWKLQRELVAVPQQDISSKADKADLLYSKTVVIGVLGSGTSQNSTNATWLIKNVFTDSGTLNKIKANVFVATGQITDKFVTLLIMAKTQTTNVWKCRKNLGSFKIDPTKVTNEWLIPGSITVNANETIGIRPNNSNSGLLINDSGSNASGWCYLGNANAEGTDYIFDEITLGVNLTAEIIAPDGNVKDKLATKVDVNDIKQPTYTNLFNPANIIVGKLVRNNGAYALDGLTPVESTDATGRWVSYALPIVPGRSYSFENIWIDNPADDNDGYSALYSTIPTPTNTTGISSGLIKNIGSFKSGSRVSVTAETNCNWWLITMKRPVNDVSVFANAKIIQGLFAVEKILDMPVYASVIPGTAVADYPAPIDGVIPGFRAATVQYLKNVFQLTRRQFLANIPGFGVVNWSIKFQRMPDGPYVVTSWPQGKVDKEPVGGAWLSGFNSTPVHGTSSKAESFTRYSLDKGVTWSPNLVIKNNPNDANARGTDCWALGAAGINDWFAIIRNRGANNNISTTNHELFRSSNRGTTWTSLGQISEITQSGQVPELFHKIKYYNGRIYTAYHFANSSRVGILSISVLNPADRTFVDLISDGGQLLKYVEPMFEFTTDKVIGTMRAQDTDVNTQLWFANLDLSGFQRFDSPITTLKANIPIVTIRNTWFLIKSIDRFKAPGTVTFTFGTIAGFIAKNVSSFQSVVIAGIIPFDKPITGSTNNGVGDMAADDTRIFGSWGMELPDVTDEPCSVYSYDFDFLGIADNQFTYQQSKNMAVLPSV